MSADIFQCNSRITQEWLCDQYSRHEENTLRYLGSGIDLQCRVASFRSVRDSTNDEIPGKLMPSSFHGSLMKKKNDNEDALAIVNRRGTLNVFITVTTKPNWPEIQRNLKPYKYLVADLICVAVYLE